MASSLSSIYLNTNFDGLSWCIECSTVHPGDALTINNCLQILNGMTVIHISDNSKQVGDYSRFWILCLLIIIGLLLTIPCGADGETIGLIFIFKQRLICILVNQGDQDVFSLCSESGFYPLY